VPRIQPLQLAEQSGSDSDEIVFVSPSGRKRHYVKFQRGRSPILDKLVLEARNRHLTFSIISDSVRHDPIIDAKPTEIEGSTVTGGIGLTESSLDNSGLKFIEILVHELVHKVEQSGSTATLGEKLASGTIEKREFVAEALKIEKEAVAESIKATIEYQLGKPWATLIASDIGVRVEQRFNRECSRELTEPGDGGTSAIENWERYYRDIWSKDFGARIP
jgi:hypothetical protein